MKTADDHQALRDSLSIVPPLLLADRGTNIKLELKPYLQPFERDLAVREIKALLGPKDLLEERHGYWTLTTTLTESFLRDRLTYWQRVGRDVLIPTRQTMLELSQNGASELGAADARLHRARRLRYGPHGVHEYRGKFFPQLVRSLITISETAEKGVILDPMCGSGTAPCEAVAFIRVALGADLNPLSVLVSRVKCSTVLMSPRTFRSRVLDHVRDIRYPETAPVELWPAADLAYINRWFAPEAISEIAGILAFIRALDDSKVRDLLLVCLSNILRSVSWQKEADLRVRKEMRPFRIGDAVARFEAAVQEQVGRIDPYLSLSHPRERGIRFSIREGNAVRVDELFPEYVGRVDLLITSPPYATALPYLDTDRLSLVVLGLLPRDEHRSRESLMIGTREVSESERAREWNRFLARERELPDEVAQLIKRIADHYHSHSDGIGFRRRNLPALLGKYYLDMLDAMASAHRMVRPGASAFYIVGNNSTTIDDERIEIPTDRFLFAIGEAAGWQGVEMMNMELLPSRDIFRDNRGSKETILWFRA